MNKVIFISFFFQLLLCAYSQIRLPLDDAPLLSSKLYAEGRWKEAILECKKEIKEGKGIDSYINLVASYIALQDYDEAYIASGEGRSVPQQQYNPRLLEMQAISCYNLGRNLESLNLLQTYLRYTSQEKDVSQIYYYMGEIYARLAQYNHADIAITAAVSIRPNEVAWWARLGYVREKGRTYRQDIRYAMQAYNKALSLDKNYSDAIAGINRLQALLK